MSPHLTNDLGDRVGGAYVTGTMQTVAAVFLLTALVCSGACIHPATRSDQSLEAICRLPATPTPGKEPTTCGEVLRNAAESPFHQALIAAHGAGEYCSCAEKEGETTLVIRYPKGGELRSLSQPSIESSKQQLILSLADRKGLLPLLRQAERFYYGNQGCGIEWSNGEKESGTTETIYRGDVCNCQARIREFSPGRFLLILSSAC